MSTCPGIGVHISTCGCLSDMDTSLAYDVRNILVERQLSFFPEVDMTTAAEQFVEGMLNPAIYPYPCTKVRLIETHISWVFLTGLRAWKVKKPVDFGFVDFTTLDRRRQCCLEELRLNRRLAPDLYLDVVPITGSAASPEIDGDGPVIDFAVCMMQFDQNHLLSNLSPTLLQRKHMNVLADQCAQFHTNAEVAPSDSPFGSAPRIRAAFEDNFNTLKRANNGLADEVSSLCETTRFQFGRLEEVFAQRKANGMIRECHGDLHLGNMFLQDDRVAIFDGIEFNDDFRWIDIISDIAFLIMDLQDRGYHGFGNRFLNRWLEHTSDYGGLSVLRLYCAYRAMVRAKIDVIRLHQENVSCSDQRHLSNDCRGYLQLAQRYSARLSPSLTITTGPSGSGKTTIAQKLIDSGDTIRTRSDVERKRLFGLAPEESSDERLRQRMYSSEADNATYDRLADLATIVIDAGLPVVVDAAFLRRTDRYRFAQLAACLGVPFMILKCSGGQQQLQERVEARQRRGRDASEADERVLAMQLQDRDELGPDEEHVAIDAGEILE